MENCVFLKKFLNLTSYTFICMKKKENTVKYHFDKYISNSEFVWKTRKVIENKIQNKNLEL